MEVSNTVWGKYHPQTTSIYAQNGLGGEASRILHQVDIISVYVSIAFLDQSKKFHIYSIKIEFKPWVDVGITLIGMYSKCGSIDEPYNVFFKEIPNNMWSHGQHRSLAMLSMDVENKVSIFWTNTT